MNHRCQYEFGASDSCDDRARLTCLLTTTVMSWQGASLCSAGASSNARSDLNDYVLLAKAGSDTSLYFLARHPSDDNKRRAAIRTIAASVIESIDKEAISRLDAFPKPNEAAAWAELGVADDNLFPPEILKMTRDGEKLLQTGSVLEDCNRRKAWERISPQAPIVDYQRDTQRELPSWTTTLLVLHALSDNQGPYHHLAPFVYLASHARVPFMRVAAIDLPIASSGAAPSDDDEMQDNNNHHNNTIRTSCECCPCTFSRTQMSILEATASPFPRLKSSPLSASPNGSSFPSWSV